MALSPPGVTLPQLRQHPSPNVSARQHGIVPYLVVVHRPAGSFKSAEATLTQLSSGVSAHVLTDSNREAVQLVPWHRKAWTCASFNSASYNLEVDDDAWWIVKRRPLTVADPAAFYSAARIVAFLCKRTGIPPTWSRDPLRTPGVIRHLDLGAAGGGHTDPTEDVALWRKFVARVKAEHDRGGFRLTWGVGELQRIDV